MRTHNFSNPVAKHKMANQAVETQQELVLGEYEKVKRVFDPLSMGEGDSFLTLTDKQLGLLQRLFTDTEETEAFLDVMKIMLMKCSLGAGNSDSIEARHFYGSARAARAMIDMVNKILRYQQTQSH